MKKLHIAPVFLGFILCAVLCFPSNASATGSSSPSEQTESSSFIRFDLTTIDWTAISSILTLAAVVTSIISNHTAQKTLNATIAIQKQESGLSMIEKRVTILATIQNNNNDNFSKIDESELRYYFNDECLALYHNYQSDYWKQCSAEKDKQKYFDNLTKQYIDNFAESPDLQDIVEDIKQYKFLVTVDPDNKELDFLSSEYVLEREENEIVYTFTYDDIYAIWKNANDNFQKSKAALITALHNIISPSIKLQID